MNSIWFQVWDKMVDTQFDLLSSMEGILAPAGLSLLNYQVLKILDQAGGQLKLSEVAERVKHSQSGTTRLVDRLEKDGLVIRKACEKDRRATYAVLTKAGKDQYDIAQPLWKSALAQLIGSRLDQGDCKTYIEILDKLNMGPTAGERDGICPKDRR